jgi:hypothetical protein
MLLNQYLKPTFVQLQINNLLLLCLFYVSEERVMYVQI